MKIYIAWVFLFIGGIFIDISQLFDKEPVALFYTKAIRRIMDENDWEVIVRNWVKET
jgi:hypothetical protein